MRWIQIILIGAIVSSGAAAEDDLGEAVGLDSSTPATDLNAQAAGESSSDLHWRAYGLIDWRAKRIEQRDNYVMNGPNIESGASIDFKPSTSLTLFTEARGFYSDEEKRYAGVLDQAGMRLYPSVDSVLALGKERNRRTPGLIVSPGDFIHANQSVPGMRPESGGVWLGRLAWQTETQSADLIALPVSRQSATGMPADDSQYAGTVARYFRRLPSGFDVGVDVGEVEENIKAGAFVQTIAAQIWKFYAESGYDDLSASASHLVGIGFEGSTTYSVRAEWYGRAAVWAPPSPMFTDLSYTIVSVGAVELLNRLNITDTLVRSLDTSHYFNLARAEWLVSDLHVVGITMTHLESGQPFRWQTTADWKVSL